MKIAFDGRVFNYELTGIGYYTLKLLQSLISEYPDSHYLLFNNFFLRYKKMMKKVTPVRGKNVEYKIVRIPSRLVKFLIFNLGWKIGPDKDDGKNIGVLNDFFYLEYEDENLNGEVESGAWDSGAGPGTGAGETDPNDRDTDSDDAGEHE